MFEDLSNDFEDIDIPTKYKIGDFIKHFWFTKGNLHEALVDLVLWCISEGHIKKKGEVV